MATAYQNLSEYDFNSVPDGSEVTVGIVVAEWNKHITEKLLEGACNTLEKWLKQKKWMPLSFWAAS